MKSTAETYHEACLEHIETAGQRHEAGEYYLCHYFAGLAVECMLRAYLRNADKFDSDHNLEALADKANFYEIVPLAQRENYGGKFSEINQRWRSNHRYFSSRQVQRFLRSIKADAGRKGDPLKNNSRAMLNLALDIINLGELKWKSK